MLSQISNYYDRIDKQQDIHFLTWQKKFKAVEIFDGDAHSGPSRLCVESTTKLLIIPQSAPEQGLGHKRQACKLWREGEWGGGMEPYPKTQNFVAAPQSLEWTSLNQG